AADIAIQARAGEQALAAAKAWRTALPDSVEAHRYVIQLLVALRRAPQTAEALASLLRITPAPEQPQLIMSLPRFFQRSPEHRQAAQMLTQVLQPYAEAPTTRAAVGVALGRAWLAANDP